MGVYILHVNEVDDINIPYVEGAPNHAAGVWFRWYQPGTFTGLIPGRSKVFGGGVTSILVTQLCIGSSDYHYC
jgi:hypothetical protein